jgi:hypothetical protein
MDPYLEAHWGDVHTRLIVYAADLLQEQMPADLKVRVEEYVAVEADFNGRSNYVPDVRVFEQPGRKGLSTAVMERGAAEPLICPLVEEPATQRTIRIVDTQSGNRVVTAIEFLSPTNKSSEGLAAYRKKRDDLRAGGVNLVEIDLLREGSYILAVPHRNIRRSHRTPYQICVLRASRPDVGEVYRATYREPLPVIRIPLRDHDPDAKLDLQTLIDTAYKRGGYDDLDYQNDPEPPLAGKDAIWADALLREAGLRA